MAKKVDSKKIMLEHSEAKVKLLGTYLERYLGIISTQEYIPKINIYDFFCGEGKYENGGEGSPIIIVEKVLELHEKNVAKTNNIPKIDIVFNDKDENKVKKLKGILEKEYLCKSEYGKIHFGNLDYRIIAEQSISYIGKHKKEKFFIYIDPYGYKEVKAGDIKNLLQYKNSEVLLFLPTQFMYRFDSKGTPAALVEFIDEIVDIKDWKSNTSVWTFIDQLKEGFRSYLDGYYVDTFTIKKDENTVYCLFFFSSHIFGFEKMLEAKWEIDKTEGKGWKAEKTGSLFSPIDFLKNKLIMFLQGGKKYNGDVYEFVLRNGFLPKHANEIFLELEIENNLFVFCDDGTKVRNKSFYINYANYKKNKNKVYYKIE